ncbi:elongation factor P 5-aminopentanone reductase [Bacillus sp. 2205SS5-2]|uniref:elongation factor P 5-aminopentanone reductase n=1 Tax=Bacillus sp. 2205SS5-2 TaxID=3109031 RepID=UPI003007C4FC
MITAKYALITGASGGIGGAVARKLASQGWNLYLHYSQQAKSVMKLMDELKQEFNIEVIPIQADFSNPDQALELTQHIFSLHSIICCSGTALYGLFQDIKQQEIDDLWNIHMKSPMLLIQNLLPKLFRTKGNVVMISSVWGQTGAACEVVYSAVKGAQLSFVKALAKEVSRNGVRVNAVAPGIVDTNMMKDFTEAEVEELQEEIPIGRFALSREIADAVFYLTSEQSTYVTGHVLSVNGGWHI